MSRIRSPGSDSRRQHRSGLPPSVSTRTVSWLPASSTPAPLISRSLACGIASKTSPLAPAVPATICSKGRIVIPGSRRALPEREVTSADMAGHLLVSTLEAYVASRGRERRLDAKRASRTTRLALTFSLVGVAEDTRFELVRACTQHAFQA